MAHVQYEIVEHDGGWTYRVGDVFAETFRTRAEAEAAAKRAAGEQRVAPPAHAIEWEDNKGRWHREQSGTTPPETDVT